MTTTTVPRGLGASGRALWRSVCSEFELTEHERALLRQAAATADLIDELQALVATEGLKSSTSQGERLHPAVSELRQQRVTLARLFTALRVPSGEDEQRRAQHRGIRGVYDIRGAS